MSDLNHDRENQKSRCPYQGLKPYQEEDADYFFGREKWIQILIDNLMASRLTLFYGASGVGKSSILHAGVAHRLQKMTEEKKGDRNDPEFAVVIFSDWRGDSIAELKKEIANHIRKISPNRDIGDISRPLTDILEKWTRGLERWSKLLIVLDQFEEFLFRSPGSLETNFTQELADAIKCPGLPVNFLISLREDALAKLDRFKSSIPNLFENYLRLPPLDRSPAFYLDRESTRVYEIPAIDAIQEPIRVYNLKPKQGEKEISIEPELVEAVLDQVKVGKVSFAESGIGGKNRSTDTRSEENTDKETAIDTSYLQLVMTRLWEAELAKGAYCLHLQTLKDLGNAEDIVKKHLANQMDSLEDKEYRNIAAKVFQYLVTPGGTKIPYPAGELANSVEESGEKIDREKLEQLLEILADEKHWVLRVVETFPDNREATTYEICHAKLGPAILDWRKHYLQKEEYKRRIALQKEEYNRKITRARSVAGGCVLVAVIVGGFALWAEIERSRASVIEIQATLNLSDSFLAQNRNLESLKAGLIAYGNLHKLDKNWLVKLPFIRDNKTLQKIPSLRSRIEQVLTERLIHVNEWRKLKVKGDSSFKNVSFILAGQILQARTKNTEYIWIKNDRGEFELISTLGLPEEKGNKPFIQVDSPDGEITATYTKGKSVHLSWKKDDFSTDLVDPLLTRKDCGESKKPLSHCNEVWEVSFSPNNALLATASADRTVKLWDLTKQGKLIQTITGHRDGVLSVSFNHNPNFPLLASAGYDQIVNLWDIKGNLINVLAGHTDLILDLSFSPDNTLLASASGDETIRLWKVNSNAMGLPVLRHSDYIIKVSLSDDGQTIATAGRDKTVRIWQRDGTLLQIIPYIAKIREVIFLDGSTLAFGGADGVVKLVKKQGVKWIESEDDSFKDPKKAHDKGSILSTIFSPESETIATASTDKTVKIWQKDDRGIWRSIGDPLQHYGEVNTVKFIQQGNTLVTASNWEKSGQIRFWQKTDRDQWSEVLPRLTTKDLKVLDIDFSPDESTIAVAAGQKIMFGKKQDEQWKWLPETLIDKDEIRAVSFSKDGNTLASANKNGTIALWQKKSDGTWRFQQTLAGHSESLWDVSFSPDGKHLVSAGSDRIAIVWDLTKLEDGEYKEYKLENLVKKACEWMPKDGNDDTDGAIDALCQSYRSTPRTFANP